MDLKTFFEQTPECAIAFSGGVDSSYLLYEAVRHAKRVQAYYMKTAFQPEFEFQDALEIARYCGVEMKVLQADILAVDTVAANPSDRCYYCKQQIFGRILAAAAEDGFTVICDGTNASDDAGDRPGMRALQEMKVLSPLRICGLTKSRIRELSRECGLATWDKPAYACLATRIPTGTRITAETLQRVEAAEGALMRAGYKDFRVRVLGEVARLQFTKNDFARAAAEREEIRTLLLPWFDTVLLDTALRG